MSKKKTLEEFKKEVYDIFNDEVEVLGEYINNNTKILVRFNCCGNEEYKRPTKLLAGQRCSKCMGKRIAKSKRKTTTEYKECLIQKGITYIEVIRKYTGINNKIRVLNKKCNHEYEANA